MKTIHIEFDEETKNANIHVHGKWTVGEWQTTISGLMHELVVETIDNSLEEENLSPDEREEKKRDIMTVFALECAQIIMNGDEDAYKLKRKEKMDLFDL